MGYDHVNGYSPSSLPPTRAASRVEPPGPPLPSPPRLVGVSHIPFRRSYNEKGARWAERIRSLREMPTFPVLTDAVTCGFNGQRAVSLGSHWSDPLNAYFQS
jgi:hypothetical protein